MCGVATAIWMFASTASRAMARLKSMFAGPSSSPGRMWQCRSITAAADSNQRAATVRRVVSAVAVLLGGVEDRAERHHEDLQVEPEGPVLDVVVVPLDPVGERGLAAQ